MARLHWFWRAGIAVAAAPIIGFGLYFGSMFVISRLPLTTLFSTSVQLALMTAFFGVPAAMSVGIYGLLSRRRERYESQTRCRRCQYILRGISEPRCPECGERI
jgi:hypothetical protein